MKKLLLLLLALSICLSLPLLAQEKETEKKEMSAEEMMPPQPLDDEWSIWMVGEWEGWSQSAQGKTQDWEKISMALGGQFLFAESKTVMGAMTYKGMGATTIHPQTGEVVGYWIDNWRGMYKGKGTREGSKLTMEWHGPTGTYKRTMEKVGDDKYTATWSYSDPSGNHSEGTSEMTKKPMMTNK